MKTTVSSPLSLENLLVSIKAIKAQRLKNYTASK